MSSLTFLNAPLLWGLALASIPLIIHLLFRRRFRQIDWAPMRYLKLTIQRNRRRIQLEQLLLLLLRTALLILLVCIVARPILNAAGIGRWLGGDTRTSQIVLLDDSLSMGLSTAGKSTFEQAKEFALQTVADVGPHDRFTLALTSQIKSPLLREIDLSDRTTTQDLLRTVQPTETFTSWASTLAALDELVQSSTYPTRAVTIITDLRRAGWEEDLVAPVGWSSDRVRVRIIDVGSVAATRQIALDNLVQSDRLALVGTPIRWDAVIRNLSDSSVDNLEATWLIDGKPSEITLPALAPGETATVPLTALFQEPGLHHVSLRLPADDLPGDNQRWDVVRVRENLRLLLVDGEPSSEPFQGEIDFLNLSLSLAIGESKAFQVEIATDADWVAAAKSDPDLIVLANVAGLDQVQADLLRKLVETGAGLIIFPGDQVDPDSYNRLLFQGGAGLLPAQLELVSNESTTGLILEENSPSAVDSLRQLSSAVLERIKIDKHFAVRLPETEVPDIRVLARWNDAASSPALIEKRFGRSRVLLWTMTADKSWSDWPIEPSYVLTMRETAKAVARTEIGTQNLTAGEALRCPISSDRQISSPTLELPGGVEPKPVTLEVGRTEMTGSEASDAAVAGPRVLVSYDTGRAGLYRLNWLENPGGTASEVYAVNPDARESDLARIATDELRRHWRGVEPEIIATAATADGSVDVRGQEIWRTLTYCMLGILGFEACFATWVGRQR
jgi:aerotolerance regulator-like protein/VWA domain-containing protein